MSSKPSPKPIPRWQRRRHACGRSWLATYLEWLTKQPLADNDAHTVFALPIAPSWQPTLLIMGDRTYASSMPVTTLSATGRVGQVG